MKAKLHRDIMLEMQCVVVIETLNPTPVTQEAQSLVSTQTEEIEESQENRMPDVEVPTSNCVQEAEEIDEKPLDLCISIRKRADEDTISISDTEEAPIIISDSSDNETDIELVGSETEQQVVSFFK